jgi:hypothetical protein
MKTKLIVLVMLIACFSCGTNYKPVSDAQKEKIKGEVKEVVNTFYKGCEDVNFDMAMQPLSDSPDFIYINNGYAFSYKDCNDIFRPVFNTFLNQKINIVDEKFTFLDKSTVLYSNHCTSLTNYKDGHAILQDPTVMLFIFKNTNNTWKAIYVVESFISKNVKNTDTSKDLNQVELHKQFVGYWKSEVAKDTTCFWDVKSYGTGFDCYFKYVSKGKTVMDGKQLWGYDKKLDKCSMSEMIKGMDNSVYLSWFTSNNKCSMLSYGDITNPDNASTKWEVEFKSPDMFLQTTLISNKPVKVDTYTRVK